MARSDALSDLNGRLLEAAGGSRRQLPEVPPREVARILGGFSDEARRCFDEALATCGFAADTELVVWSDPANSFLVPFWAATLGVRPAVLLVHRDPEDVAAALMAPAWIGKRASINGIVTTVPPSSRPRNCPR